MKTKGIPLVAAALLLLTARGARAQTTQVFSSTIPLTPTTFSGSLPGLGGAAIPRFNPALGTLNQVRMRLRIDQSLQATYSTGVLAGTYAGTVNGTFAVVNGDTATQLAAQNGTPSAVAGSVPPNSSITEGPFVSSLWALSPSCPPERFPRSSAPGT